MSNRLQKGDGLIAGFANFAKAKMNAQYISCPSVVTPSEFGICSWGGLGFTMIDTSTSHAFHSIKDQLVGVGYLSLWRHEKVPCIAHRVNLI
jgi:hypothetical protein